jgi:hypothetical protein
LANLKTQILRLEFFPKVEWKYLVKELKVNGAEGLCLGENIRYALKRAGLEHHKNIVVVNDTVVATKTVPMSQ